MFDALPASLNAEVDPRCNLWIFRWPSIQPGAARNQQAVEHVRRLSRRRILPKFLAIHSLSLRQRRRKREPLLQMQSLSDYSSLICFEDFNAQHSTPNGQKKCHPERREGPRNRSQGCRGTFCEPTNPAGDPSLRLG